MTGDLRLFDTNLLVHAYTVSNERKHDTALSFVEKVWEGEEAATTLQNLCEFFFVVTRKVSRPIPIAAAETTVKAILASSRWRVIDRTPDTLLKAIELVKVTRVPFWDALIGVSMLEHGIETIVTENDRDFKKIRGVTAINPFK
ncbi:MAG TPA: PIN domain-containing protein [Candidatus Binatia bacterium]|jgi:predicted nucleic acid-binding protein|nr:PIN domain-containing protein [Candidatus Binatia bacterium]